MRHFFGHYYARRPNYVVADLRHREWMWHPFDTGIYRHMLLYDEEELGARLANKPPLHVYHSLASYTQPDVRDMQTKHRGRQRWEVLMDIDVKPDASMRRDLGGALEQARRQFITTLQILERDLGLNQYLACFSGSKGYHCRLAREDLQQLSAGARRELGRLIGGHGAEFVELFPSLDPAKPLFPASVPAGGLKRRIYLAMIRIRSMANDQSSHELFLRLCERHAPPLADPSDILSRIHDASSPQALLEDPASTGAVQTWFQMARELACPSLDQSAIADASRMVRLQGSINGRTGLVCKPLAGIDAVEAFDPLTDANPHPADVDVRLTGRREAHVDVAGQRFEVHAGQDCQLPIKAAMLLVATGQATPHWPPGSGAA